MLSLTACLGETQVPIYRLISYGGVFFARRRTGYCVLDLATSYANALQLRAVHTQIRRIAHLLMARSDPSAVDYRVAQLHNTMKYAQAINHSELYRKCLGERRAMREASGPAFPHFRRQCARQCRCIAEQLFGVTVIAARLVFFPKVPDVALRRLVVCVCNGYSLPTE